MMTMRSLKILALALAVSASPVLAQFEGVIEMKIEGGGGTKMSGTGKTYVTKSAWRTEMEMTSPELQHDTEKAKALGGRTSIQFIVLGKVSEPGVSYMLNERTKTYSRIDADEMKKGLPKSDEKKWSIQRLGKDRVAGLSCENVKVTEEGKKSELDLCMTREIASGEWLRALQRQRRGLGGAWVAALNEAGIEGFPVRMVMKESENGPVTMKMETTKVERKSLPASLFEIPPGYKETSLLGVMAQTPEQAQKLEAARKQMDEMMKNMTPEQRKQMEEMMKKMGQQKQ
jgi:hypothetical protein